MIKINRTQEIAFQQYASGTTLYYQLQDTLKNHGKREWKNEQPLNDIPFDDFVTLLVTREYEVQRTLEEIINDFISDSKKDEWDTGEQCLIDLKRELQLEGLI